MSSPVHRSHPLIERDVSLAFDEFDQAFPGPDEDNFDTKLRDAFDGPDLESKSFEQRSILVDIVDEDSEVINLGDHR